MLRPRGTAIWFTRLSIGGVALLVLESGFPIPTGEGGPDLGLEGNVEGLGALGPPEADERPLEVEIIKVEKADARIASGRRLEDRDNRPVAQVERSLSGAASFEGPDIVERRALRRRLLGRQERVEGRPPARPAERVHPEEALVDEPDRVAPGSGSFWSVTSSNSRRSFGVTSP